MHDAGPLIVLAGPGTGKTRVIVSRIARILRDGAEPESVLAVTFSVKAANEMRERLELSVGAEAQRVRVSTFHALGAELLRRFGDWIGLPQQLTIMDSAQQNRLCRELIRRHNLYPMLVAQGRDRIIGEARAHIGAFRNAGLTPEAVLRFAQRRLDRARAGDFVNAEGEAPTKDELVAEQIEAEVFVDHARLFALRDEAALRDGDLTFDDFLALPLRLFSEKPVTASIVRSETRHVLVDEFQDVNGAQIELLRRIAPPPPGGGESETGRQPDLCVVGDDDQAIYAFRGADPRAFDRFAEVWKEHEVIRLTENYRSLPGIVAVANAVIAPAERFAPDKKLHAAAPPELGPGELNGVIVPDDKETGAAVAAMIFADRQSNPSKRWSDYAVIARTNPFRDTVGEELRVQGIPVDLRIAVTPADDDAVQDLLCWLRLACPTAAASASGGGAGAGATADLVRVLVRPVGAQDPARVFAWRDRYETEVGRTGGAGGTEPPGFLEWIVASEPAKAPVAEVLRLLREFRAAAATENAQRLVERIIRSARLAAGDGFGTDLLDGRERAKRVERLAQVIGFVRSRQEFLDPPGDGAAFLRYYDDLDASERQFKAPGFDQLGETPEDEADSGVDAVRVLTAHKAKGLEFDTVFVVRVRPQHGYPLSERAGGGVELPAELTGRPSQSHADEERRIFYVACTRAKRRLVLIAKSKAKATKVTDYFIELTDGDPRLGVKVSAAQSWYDLGEVSPASSVSEEGAIPGETERAAIIRRELAGVRRRALALLHEAEAGAPADRLAAINHSLSEAAEELAAIALLRRGPDGPPPVSNPALAARLGELSRRLERAERSPGLFGPLTAPLSLSYSTVSAYLRCPRCFYLSHVLRVRPLESDEQSFGNAAHQALKDYYSERREAEADGREPPGVGRLIELAEMHQRRATRGRPDPETLAQLRAQMRTLAEKLEDNRAERHQDLETSVRVPFELDGHRHVLTAKIDRLDAMPDGTWRIIDYKTGQAWKTLTEPKPDDLQLGIYALALPALLSMDPGDTPEGEAQYWCLATGQIGRIALSALRLDKVRGQIGEAAAGMLRGGFERGSKCMGHCELLG